MGSRCWGAVGGNRRQGVRVLAPRYPCPRRPSTPWGRKPPTTKPLLPLIGGGAQSEFGPQVGPEHVEMCAHGEGAGGGRELWAPPGDSGPSAVRRCALHRRAGGRLFLSRLNENIKAGVFSLSQNLAKKPGQNLGRLCDTPSLQGRRFVALQSRPQELLQFPLYPLGRQRPGKTVQSRLPTGSGL